MRRVELLVGVVGECENDPGRLCAGFEGADLDAPHDAVGAGRGRDLDPIALSAVALDRPGEVDCVGIGRDPDRLNRTHRCRARKNEGEQENEAKKEPKRSAGQLAYGSRPPRANDGKRGRLGGAQNNLGQFRKPSAARRRRSRAARKERGRAMRHRS